MMTRTFLLTASLFCALRLFNPNLGLAYEAAIGETVAAISPGIENARLKTVAVVDFTDLQGCASELGRLVAEDLSIALAQASTDFQVIDRTHLKAILAEHKLNSSGLIDPNTAKQLGSIAGVNALVTGTITPFGRFVKITVKVIDTQSAHILAASSSQVQRTQALEELLSAVLPGGCGGNGVATNPEVSNSGHEPRQPLLVSSEGFDLQLTGCGYSAGQLLCTVLITNRREDRRMGCSDARFIDMKGGEFKVERAEPRWAEYARDVPMRSSLLFDRVSQVDELALLEIRCAGRGARNVRAQWRNIRLASSARRGQVRGSPGNSIKAESVPQVFQVIYDQLGMFAFAAESALAPRGRAKASRHCKGLLSVSVDRVAFDGQNCKRMRQFDYHSSAIKEVTAVRLKVE